MIVIERTNRRMTCKFRICIVECLDKFRLGEEDGGPEYLFSPLSRGQSYSVDFVSV